ncbi:fibrocystin-L [Xenopus tropicalis]|uniref:Fibrocystin-L n=1 Tax=Xenopus tropicalis TaxID=8364 RepID=A0A8J1JRF2_XENTR|nr:fibrocystin-L [Xenopus tropicalis]
MIEAVLLLLSALTQVTYGQLRVNGISPNSGSLNGATRITILGQGFADANQFDYGDGNAALGNSVQLVSATLSIPCDVEKDASHAGQITCYTRPMPADSYLIRVSVDGVPVPDSNICYGNLQSGNCRFTAHMYYTPVINTITPFSGTPGAMITIRGKTFTNVYGSNTALSSNSRNVRVLRVYGGGMPCNLLIPKSDTLYRLQLDSTNSDMGTLTCRYSGTYVGHLNISFILDSNYGRSLPSLATYFVSSLNKITMFQTYAEITGISPSVGSTEGGTIITITGSNFDQTDAPARVLVGGQDCIVLGLTDTTITCRTPPRPSVLPTLFPGSRGLKCQMWNKTSSYAIDQAINFNESTPNYAGVSWVEDASQAWPLLNFIARLSGFFVPSETDDYTFYIKGDDYYILMFSETGDPANKTKVANSSYFPSYFSYPSQMSRTFRLQKGKPYYIEIYLKKSGGTSAVNVGVYKPSSVYSETQTADAVNELQGIVSQTTVLQEQQIITLQNWSTSTATEEVQTITVTKLCDSACPVLFYRLIVGSEKTDYLSADASAADVQTALNNLWSLKPDTFNVTMTSSSNENIYTVTFNSQRGEFQLLSYETPDGSNLTVTVAEETKGRADMGTFTLVWDGVYSKPIADNASPAEVESAIEGMLSSMCPDGYVYKENMAVKFFKNYENDFTPMCFAYKGAPASQIYLAFQYQANSGPATLSHYFSYNFPESDSWTYTCVDLLNLIKTTFPGTNYYVQTIGLQAASVFYIDVLYIGQVATTNNINGAAVRREPALASRGIMISDVAVTSPTNSSLNNQYNIIITPANCGYNIPLLSVGFAVKTENISGKTATYRGGLWPNGTAITITRTQAASPPIGGTFSIEAYGKQIQGLAVNISSSDLQYALQTIPELGRVSVSSRSVSCAGNSWNIKYLTSTGSQPLLQINDSLVTGINARITAKSLIRGGLFRQHLLGDFLRTPNKNPQVEVYINGIPSKCSGNCDYTWVGAQTPVITGINTTTSSVDGNETWPVLLVSGAGFSKGSINDTSYVTIGDAPCAITSISETEIQCLIQPASAGTFPIKVYIGGSGFALSTGSNLTYTVQSSISAVSPSSGSLAGGTLVTLIGTGFSEGSVVQFGSNKCDILFANLTTIQCRTEAELAGSVDVVVLTNGFEATLPSSFSYNASFTPVITAISSNRSSVLGGAILTISGNSFGSQSPNSAVLIGNVTCQTLQWNQSDITCTLPSNPPGNYSVLVLVDNLGFASVSSPDQSSITYVLEVNSLHPKFGSLYGGTHITVTGSGFSTDQTSNAVKIGDVPCNITSSSENELICTVQSPGKVFTVTNNGIDPVYGSGYAWLPSSLYISLGDTVVWTWQPQPFLTGLGYRVFSVSDPANVTHDGKTFISGNTVSPSGVFSYKFTSPGTYYYSSGYVNDARTIFLQGVVYVSPAQDQSSPIYVSVGGIKAQYNPASAFPSEVDSCLAPEPTCPQLSNITSSNSLSFGFSSCFSSSITSISPSYGTIHDSITINGTGFSDTECANQVTVGQYPCTVSYADQNTVICNVDPQNSMPVGIAELVSLTVDNYGNAINAIAKEMDRRFALLPHIDSVTPNNGSTTGFTRVTIHGSGFSYTNGSTVISGLSCTIISVNYTDIICDTLPGTPQNIQVNVLVNNIGSQCKGSCSFSYISSASPAISSISPTSIYNSTTLYITGSGLGTSDNDILVYVGNWLAQVISSNDTDLACTIGPIPAGSYTVKVIVLSTGLATGKLTVTSPAQATLLTPSGSTEGGTLLSITGNGFDPLSTTVLVGGTLCHIVSVAPSNIQCLTPPSTDAGTATVSIRVRSVTYPPLSFSYSQSDTPIVSSVVPDTGVPGTSVTITGSGFGSDATKTSVTIGNTACTIATISDTQVQCTMGNHSGGTFPVILKTEKGFAKSNVQFNYQLTLTNVSPNTGSFAGGLMITLTGSGFDQLNSRVFVCNSECQVDRDQSNPNSLFCAAPPQNASGSTRTCDVQVANGNNYIQLNSSFTYNSSLTPIIFDVTPKRGGTAGGTNLTITGSQFSSDISQITVTVAKAKCQVHYANSTHIICVTGAHSPSQRTKVQVNIEGKGLATMENASFFYIDVWSSRYTWGGDTLPDEGSLAVITQGQTILLDQSTPVLKMLLIQGGSLIFDEADIELRAENILITNGGLLQIGTEDAPFQHKAIITLHGHLRSPELPVYGAKTLAVRQGTLDLHGQPVPVTWTRLAQTAEAGTSTLILQKSVTWKPGDEIVIASTGDRHSQRENEKMTILSISQDGRTVNLTQPLTYKHLGISVTLPDGTIFDARAEVGVLTRNILVRGSTNVEWSDTIPACPDGFDPGEFATQTCFQGRFGEEVGSDQFGGCIMFHAPKPNQLLSIGRIEYVEVFHAGQAFRLGRYPIHWHLMGDLQFKSYVRGCGIHQTYNRAVTIQNTHHLLVENTVIYDIMGGAFFIEDGIEHGNVLQYNLAVFVQQSTSLLNDDVTPAGFWVTNPNNTVRHNAVAGGTHFGFWYRMHDNPDGLSYNPSICQKRVPLGEFYNNTVHSQGWYGIWIFQEYFPKAGGGCGYTIPQPAAFKSLTTWNSQKGAEWVNGGALQFHNFTLVNNQDAGIEMKRVFSEHVGGWGEAIGAEIKNTKIVGHVDELGLGSNYCTARGIVLPFDEGLTVSSVTFMNFDRLGCASIGVTSIAGLCIDRCGGWSTRFDGIKYFNSPNKAGFRWEHEVVLIDTDGTLTGGTGNKVVPKSGLLDPSQCSKSSDWSVGFSGYVCNSTVRFHRLAFNNPTPTSLTGKDVILSNSFGVSVVPFLTERLTHRPGWMALLPSTDTYNWYFRDAAYMSNISYQSTFYGLENSDFVIVSHNLTQRPDRFTIVDTRNGSQQQVTYGTNNNGDWYFNDNTTTLYYLVSGKHKLQKRAVAGTLDPNMINVDVNLKTLICYYKNCVPPPPPASIVVPSSYDFTLLLVKTSPVLTRTIVQETTVPCIFLLLPSYWSNHSFWESSVENNKTVPKEGSNVIIPADKWVIADVDIPPLEKLVIYGILEIRNLTNNSTSKSSSVYRTTVLNATYISIQGGRLIAGKENDPFQGELHIILKGNHSTPEMPLPDGPNQGSKVLGVFGQLDLHGMPRSVYRTKLARTAAEGSQTITLVDAVDWQAGEEILITTTSYDTWQTETRQIITVSPDMRTITLNASLNYTHIAESYSVANTSWNYTLAADVALLTRNIKIIGQDYPGWYQESFGVRVLVSTFSMNNVQYTGSARIENVEFYHSGQLGYTDPSDPRFSLAFLYLGEVSRNTSYVQGCSFHQGFSPAIGVFATNGLDIEDNVIYFTVGEGIIVSGERITVRGNLVSVAVWPGTYQGRFQVTNNLWNAGIEISEGTDIVLQNNVVAGFERVGYHINGEPCTDGNDTRVQWLNNEAHGGLYGVYMNKDGLLKCSLIRRFTVWRCWDYGFYFQVPVSLKITESVLVDNGMGIFTIVYGPAATSHELSNKTVDISKSLLVGSSPSFNCSDILTDNDPNIKISAGQRSIRPLTGGRSGICWPSFISSQNGAPKGPFAGTISYNSITGLMTVKDTTFIGYKSVCANEANIMFITNPLNDDLQHPIEVSGIQMADSTEDQKVFIHRPDLSKVNPSDCVDMDCDAKKKSLLKDLDGSFLGHQGAVVPQSEYAWDTDPRYGVGDYRIPKVMLTQLNGSRIPVAEVAPYKGIIRDSSCVYMSAWEAYKCFGLNYEMLVIESLDSDTETRRLSPVAVLGGGYVDLINGPQDHGWCAGYTCQKRVSLFHAIVATNKSFDIYFTSTSPQSLRLILLNTNSSKAVRVGIFYSNPQRLDVYVNNSYVLPTNGYVQSNGDILFKAPSYTGQYTPQLSSNVDGENYFDNDYKMLYILVRGSTPVVVRTSPLIIVSFNLPAMTEDQFYGANLVTNLALFLKIPVQKIRITKIIAEGSRRRKRAAGGLTVSVQIADRPGQLTNSTNGTGTYIIFLYVIHDTLNYSDFQSISQSLAAAAVNGSLSSILNVTVGSLSISNPIPSPGDPAWNQFANQTVDRTESTTGNYLASVSTLVVVVQPVAGTPGQVLSQQPAVMALDSKGACVSVSVSSLSLTARLKKSNNAYVDSGLGGNTTILFNGCWANYTDLTLKLPGSGFTLEFTLNNIYGQTRSFDSRTSGSASSTASGFANNDLMQAIVLLAITLLGMNLFTVQL